MARELEDNQNMFQPIPASALIKPFEQNPLLNDDEDFLINVDSDSDNVLSEVEQEDSESDTNVDSETQNSDSE